MRTPRFPRGERPLTSAEIAERAAQLGRVVCAYVGPDGWCAYAIEPDPRGRK